MASRYPETRSALTAFAAVVLRVPIRSLTFLRVTRVPAGLVVTSVIALAAGPACILDAETPARWKSSGSIEVRESFDDNVFLQESGPLAGHSSRITSLRARLGTVCDLPSGFAAAFAYAPELARFHDERAEDHLTHRGSLFLSGTSGDLPWELRQAVTWIDGASRNLVFDGVGGAPAAGGVPIRERRDALVYRGGGKATLKSGPWWLRACADAYIHDFRSEQSTVPGYQNYADRNDVSGGADLGRRVDDSVSVFFGYRYGRQGQEQLFGTGADYDNTYQRLLAGFEGALRGWLKISGSAGPDLRDFGPSIAAGAAAKPTLFYYDVRLTVTPRTGDQVALTLKQFAQPAFGGRSVYEDFTGEVRWRHAVDKRWSFSTVLRAYNADFLSPVRRDDWIFTAALEADWRLNRRWSARAEFNGDIAESRIADTPAREFHHSVVSLGLRCELN